jgi:hypothetical protein
MQVIISLSLVYFAEHFQNEIDFIYLKCTKIIGVYYIASGHLTIPSLS